ncbi:ABC transporter permease [Fulvimarina sp. MAC8]|uniref:ABC transporter permease n=1 Tax=Fulvimarina sp. MAC8 TaxID=3162874 RepID=UPI0032EB8BBE
MTAIDADTAYAHKAGTADAGLLPTMRLAWRFALREMRGGLNGFIIFLLCITLGVGAIAAVNSVASMMSDGIAREGRAILGGDMRFQLVQRERTPEEASYIDGLGEISETAGLRSMVRLEDGSDQSLAEVKAVDDAYPLYGSVETTPPIALETLFEERNGRYGAIAAQELYDRLGVEPGAIVRLGDAEIELTGVLNREPDILSDGFAFAPRLMMSRAGLDASGLIQPGSLVEYDWRVRLPAGSDAEEVADEARDQFPTAGFRIRTAEDAAPSLQRNIERFSQFLTLVGLTALIVGGVGVANAVRAYLDSKRPVIASFKSLGAAGRLVVFVYLFQIMTLAAVGVVMGLILGAIAPFLTASFLESVIPVGASASFYPGALLIAALFGFLTALTFALLPLGQTRDVAATALFRDAGATATGKLRWTYAVGTVVLALCIAGLALFMARDKQIALIFLGGTAAAFVILRAVAIGVMALARRAPKVQSTPLRLALGNIHRPGALTPSVVLSLGLGLTLLVTLAIIDYDLRQEVGTGLASRAPNFFFVDIQNNEIDQFRQTVEEAAPGSTLNAVPMLRGRITHLGDQDVATMEIPEEGGWVLRGDRGITYAAETPENSSLSDGEWWAEDYDGPPLVSFADEEGRELGLEVGETITVNVLGRSITAEIANFRVIEWENLSINFVMVFSPNTFEGAPHAWLATLTLDDGGADRSNADVASREKQIVNTLTNAFPAVTTVRVKDALDAVNSLIAQLALAIRVAAGVALIASVLVLAGALAAGNRARVHDAVVLKTLGATRATLIKAFATEYALLGLATGIFAIGAGAIASWFVVDQIMTLPYVFDWTVALTTLVVSLVLTVGFGLAGTWRILGQKAAPVLRNL